jgi:hypothetical protein
MSLLSSIQSRIENKIFSRLGSIVVRTPYTSQVVDKWGDATITSGSSENVTAVPYNYLQNNEMFEKFGELVDGETLMAFKHNQGLNINDVITFDGKTFIIKEITKFPLSDGNVLKVARLTERL